ncbi:MAG: glycosyltransferase family 2 protein [Planctomycetaceae bacterium]|nr:glycosyltransferase family 2 protein [Planctomycetaceae bacterium]
MSPIISIIIPVYNAVPYLRESLDSVANQTMREIQIICINDGSTDDSPAILEEYANRDSRFLIVNQNNAGVASARNVGLSLVTGKYILFVDSDDTIDSSLCEKVYKKAEQSNADFVLFFHDTPNGHNHVCDTTINPDDKVGWQEKKVLLSFGTIWGKLWRNNFLTKHNLKFYEKLRCFDDVMFYWQGLLLALKVAVLPETLYHYYVRESSLTTWHGKHCLAIFDEFTECKLFLKKNGLYQSYKEYFLRVKIDMLFSLYHKIEREFETEFCEKIKNSLDEEEKIYLRNERHIDHSVTYFYYYCTGDWLIFLMYLRRRIRAFLGTSKRNVIIFVANIIKKFSRQSS